MPKSEALSLLPKPGELEAGSQIQVQGKLHKIGRSWIPHAQRLNKRPEDRVALKSEKQSQALSESMPKMERPATLNREVRIVAFWFQGPSSRAIPEAIGCSILVLMHYCFRLVSALLRPHGCIPGLKTRWS